MKKPAKRLMNRREAWTFIAKKLLRNGKIKSGLCLEIGWLEQRIAPWTQHRMELQLRDHIAAAQQSGFMTGAYIYTTFYPYYVTGAGAFHEERALACLWMALEAEAEDEPARVLMREVYEQPMMRAFATPTLSFDQTARLAHAIIG